jgi:protein-tyrosine phosphatase
MDAEGAPDKILGALNAADAAGEKVVIHCSGGSGRTSLGLGLWLAAKHGLSAEQARIQTAAICAPFKPLSAAHLHVFRF